MRTVNKHLSKLLVILTPFIILSCSKHKTNNNIVEYDGYRFQILSPTLVCIQKNNYENRKDLNYEFEKCNFNVKSNNNQLIIKTDSCLLTYNKNKGSITDKLTLQFKRNGSVQQYSLNTKDYQNLGGLVYSLDRCNGRKRYARYDLTSPHEPMINTKGLLSSRGWTLLRSKNNRLIHGDNDTISSEIFVFCYSNNYRQALKDFTTLNGSVPLLPQWSLGNWFSRYQPLKDNDYKKIVMEFRKNKLPIDVIVPDMNWHTDGWFGLRYDTINFPDMKAFFNWTKKNNVYVGFNHHPGALNPDDPRVDDFIKKLGLDYDSLRVKAELAYEETQWDVFKDVLCFGEKDSAIITAQFKEFIYPILNDGLSFNWVDGSPTIENLSQYYNLTEQYLNKRSFVLTRQQDGSFEHHRYPMGFSGDTYISWESLEFNIEHTIKAANQSVYWSHDIGGHIMGEPVAEYPELFVRWVQSAALSPFCRLHATGGVDIDTCKMHERRPYRYDTDVQNASRIFFQLKYKLLPYTYSLNKQAHDNGLLMCRGMYIDYSDEINAYKYMNSQYMFGPFMLVAPVTEAAYHQQGIKGSSYKNVWIPEGTWYDYFTGESIEGPAEALAYKNIREMPLYIKEGAIIPMDYYMESTNDKPNDRMMIEFYQPTHTMQSEFELYEDDGQSLEYRRNNYRTTQIHYQFDENKGTLITIQANEGDYEGASPEKTYELIIKHLAQLPAQILMNGQAMNSNQWSFQNNQLTIKTGKQKVVQKLTIRIE